MNYRFWVERLNFEQSRIVVRAADGSTVMTSTSFASEDTQHAIETCRSLIERDWCYRIVNQRRTGPCFELHRPHSPIRWVSRRFSSCDAMEREIEHLKAATAITPIFHRYDVVHGPNGPERGDVNEPFAARPRALA